MPDGIFLRPDGLFQAGPEIETAMEHARISIKLHLDSVIFRNFRVDKVVVADDVQSRDLDIR